MPPEVNPQNPYRQKTWKHFVVSELRSKGPQSYKELSQSAVAVGQVTGDAAEKKAYDAITIACGEIRAENAKGKVSFTVVKNADKKQQIQDVTAPQ